MKSRRRTEPAALPEPCPDVVARRLDDEVVLVNLQTNRIFALNETGARFWELLVEDNDREAVEAVLCREFDGAPEAVSESIDMLVAELRAVQLVRDPGDR